MNALPLWLIALSWIAKLVLAILIGLSVWSVSIMWDRRKVFLETKAGTLFDGVKNAIKASGSKDPEKIQLAYRGFIAPEKAKLENGFTALATLASNAPFIGLFGTVLGIIEAFGELAVLKSDTTQIMASISVALIATAVGLLVAIPAGIAYNIYLRKLKLLLLEVEAMRDTWLAGQ